MTDRPASWRMPNAKQMEKMAAALSRKATVPPALAPNNDLPPEYWQALLEEARAKPSGSSIAALRLGEIVQHLLRVNCRRCNRCIEIQRLDAVRLYGQRAVWKDVGLRLLDDTCTQRTGRHEEDGCWPFYDAP
ncbi:hypothetical protein OZ411_02535 [Bradyrhizobium sp. Arg237L]|uniref:hypothetical protein n=1 Tax=Bradyrhizobium sp. Arg237L TaxID=3003352 RepID=UPI00249F6C1C|nr:hypothetical protein [Bradyrhizobium sp. Arg237L]MDI4231688.1 hypothetical protein [Bradyrhizobium sp. Arg237L]